MADNRQFLQRARIAAVAIAVFIAAWLILGRNVLGGAVTRNAAFVMYNRWSQQTPDHYPDRQQIRSLLDSSLSAHPDSDSAWRLAGFMQLEDGEEDAAIASWHNAGEMATELLGRADLLASQSNPAEALRWYRMAVAVEPDSTAAWLKLGNLLEEQGDWPEAVRTYESAVDYLDTNGAPSSDITYKLARALSISQDTIDWSGVFEQTSKAQVQDNFGSEWNRTQNLRLAGQALLSSGRDAEAADVFRHLLEDYPDDYWANLQLARLVWEMDQDAGLAEQLFQKALEIRQDNKWAYLGLASVYRDTQRPDAAESLYRQVLELAPNDPTALAWFEQN